MLRIYKPLHRTIRFLEYQIPFLINSSFQEILIQVHRCFHSPCLPIFNFYHNWKKCYQMAESFWIWTMSTIKITLHWFLWHCLEESLGMMEHHRINGVRMVISLQIRIRAALAKDALLIRYIFLHDSGLEINVAVIDSNLIFFLDKHKFGRHRNWYRIIFQSKKNKIKTL